MKIGIVGAGAMGGLFGGMLAKEGEDVWLLDNHRERAEKVDREGLIIEKSGAPKPKRTKEEIIRIRATTDPSRVGPCGLVIILVKAYDTEEASRNSLPLAGEDTVWLTLQNGLGNVEKIGKIVGEERVVAGVTCQGATVIRVGRIRHAGFGKTVVGEIGGKESKRVRCISDIFNNAGIETEISDNIEGTLWDKLMVNAVINPLTAIMRVRNGQLLESPYLRETMKVLVEEAMQVPLRNGIKLPYRRLYEKVEEQCRVSKENISSMLQDIMRKRRTEIDYINGAIVSEGERIGVPTPVNRTLWNMVRFLEGRIGDVK